MAAYNPPQQILFSPVSNYYQGKAIRAGLAAQEQDAEFKDLQIDLAEQELKDVPTKREAARKAALLQQENIRTQIDERLRQGEREELELSAKALTPLLTDYSNEKNEDLALEGFNKNIGTAIQSLSEKEQLKVIEAMGEDKQFDHDEVHRIGLGVRMFTDDEKGDRSAQKFIDRDGNAVQGSMDKQGNYFDSSGVQRTDITPIAPGATQESIDPRTDSQLGGAYQQNLDEYNKSSDVQELISSTLPQVIEMPGAVGAKGAITTAGSGLLTSLGQDEMAGAFAQYMSGATQEEVAALQTQLQTLRGRVTDILTGEGSSRLSETERAIASNAVGLIDQGLQGPSDLTKAYPRVVGAMNQLYAESWATKYRLAERDKNIPYPYDLSDKSQRIELLTEFSESGVGVDTAKRTVVRLKSIQGVE